MRPRRHCGPQIANARSERKSLICNGLFSENRCLGRNPWYGLRSLPCLAMKLTQKYRTLRGSHKCRSARATLAADENILCGILSRSAKALRTVGTVAAAAAVMPPFRIFAVRLFVEVRIENSNLGDVPHGKLAASRRATNRFRGGSVEEFTQPVGRAARVLWGHCPAENPATRLPSVNFRLIS